MKGSNGCGILWAAKSFRTHWRKNGTIDTINWFSYITILDHILQNRSKILRKWTGIFCPTVHIHQTLRLQIFICSSMSLSGVRFSFLEGINKFLGERIASRHPHLFLRWINLLLERWENFVASDSVCFEWIHFVFPCLNKYLLFINKGRKYIPILNNNFFFK